MGRRRRENGDTITIDGTHIGLDLRLSARGSGRVTLRDAGWISTITTINLVTGESTIQVDVHGPYPEADRPAFLRRAPTRSIAKHDRRLSAHR